MRAGDIEIILFDLGGVVVDFSGLDDIVPLLTSVHAREELTSQWVECDVVRGFETGALSPAEFGDAFVKKWRLDVEPKAFLAAFQTWTRGFYPGARELIERLRTRYRVACLSNSNPLHWEENLHVHQVQPAFDDAMSSHQLGYHKPDRQIYEAALKHLNVAAEKVFFLDDVEANVEAAKDAGMHAIRARGVRAVETSIESSGLL